MRHRSSNRRLWLRLLGAWLLVLASCSSSWAQWPGSWQFSLVQLRSELFVLEGLRLRQASDGFELELRRLQLGALNWSQLRLHCAAGRLGHERIDCRAGRLSVAGQRLPLQLSMVLHPLRGDIALRLRFASGGELRLNGTATELEVGLQGLTFASLDQLFAALLPQTVAGALDRVRAWQPQARLDARLHWQAATGAGGGRLSLQAMLAEGSFARHDGLQAGEALQLEFALEATAEPAVESALRAGVQSWQWQAEANWQRGAVYVHPLYVEAGPSLHARGHYRADEVFVELAEIELEGVEQFALSARLGLAPFSLDDLAFSLAGADLALVGPRWLTPLFAPALAERLRFAGHAGAAVELRDGRLHSIDAAFDGAGISLLQPAVAGGKASGWSFGPLSGHLPWRAEEASTARLEIDGGRWGALALGGFSVEASIERAALNFELIRIPLLDGALLIDGLAFAVDPDHLGAGWQGEGSVVVEPLSMAELSTALGWPRFGGRLAASLPGMRIRGDEISFDGALVVSLFDGYIQATGLRVRQAFGLASQLSADVEARHLDLAQLTDAFSFGSMSGFIDFDIRQLDLLRWVPVGFDFRLGSSPGSGGGRISQRAVQNISALGGGGALAAMQRGVLSLFDTFGYRELGLSCVLRNGVCVMGGIEAARSERDSFVIIRGGGIPALDVIGYNSRVDWDVLVERLQRVLEQDRAAEVR